MNDYVSREALIALARPGTFATSCDGATRQEDAVPVRVIQGVPAANVTKLIRACWAWDGYDYEKPWVCSKCRYHSENETNYCPKRGAKMTEVESDA